MHDHEGKKKFTLEDFFKATVLVFLASPFIIAWLITMLTKKAKKRTSKS